MGEPPLPGGDLLGCGPVCRGHQPRAGPVRGDEARQRGNRRRGQSAEARSRHASFYDISAGAGKPDSAKREAFRARTRTDLTHVLNLLRDGVLTAQIAARFPLTEAAAALELAESSTRTAPGKVILMP
nr:zinc-binding dehydrogenase [Streptomyces canus]